ncbi:MAG: gamma carbonic anhydrase family protein [Puniceicoccales bacterium]|nr:gamma carbonic anhydrase family protein [Puniceicoccales bacterium]
MQQSFLQHRQCQPNFNAKAFIAPQAIISGNVRIDALCSVWPNAVLRGDLNKITVEQGSNIQENVVVHVSFEYDVVIGQYVTVGHGAIVHGCHVGNHCLIGMHATLLDGARIGDYCIIGAHTLVTQQQIIPSHSLVTGVPGKVVRTLTDRDMRCIEENAHVYLELITAL